MKVKGLRVAAYLLIAHFVIILGLAAVGQGSPNYLHLVLAFTLLIAASTALFSPRKRGWWAVLGYVIVVLGQHVMGLWVMWSNPAMPLATKMGALVFLAVIDSLVFAALVLVFKPANFAAFASPAAGAGVTQDPVVKV